MRKQIWKPAAILVLTALLLLGLTSVLQTVKAARELEAREFILSYLLMDGTPFEEEPYSGEDETITAVYRGTGGYVVETTVDGYAAPVVLWVGVKDDGYVTGVTVRDMDETYGLGRNAMFDVDYLLQYLRTTGEANVGADIDAMTGATVSSRAITRGVNAAVAFVTGADVSSGATEWGG